MANPPLGSAAFTPSSSYRALMMLTCRSQVRGSGSSGDDAVERSAAESRWRRGLDYGYNLDHAEALADIRGSHCGRPERRDRASAGSRDHLDAPAVSSGRDHRRRLSRSGARKGGAANASRRPRQRVQQSRRTRRSRSGNDLFATIPIDPDAHFQLGAAAALRASYIATIEGRVFDSLGPGRRAYSEHKRTIALDPSRKDAGLIVGMYRYTVANLSLPKRLMARLAGFEGGRASA